MVREHTENPKAGNAIKAAAGTAFLSGITSLPNEEGGE